MANKTKKRKPVPKIELSENLKKYLLTAQLVKGDAEIFLLAKNPEKLKQAWRKYEAGILPEFIKNNPGTRPWTWWQAGQHRRERIGGTGTPSHEFLAEKQVYDFGIPAYWLDQWLVDYYNGRAQDVRGNLVGNEFKDGGFEGVAFSQEDPPVFESETAYLKRHNLLTKDEEQHIKKADYEPETLIFNEED